MHARTSSAGSSLNEVVINFYSCFLSARASERLMTRRAARKNAPLSIQFIKPSRPTESERAEQLSHSKLFLHSPPVNYRLANLNRDKNAAQSFPLLFLSPFRPTRASSCAVAFFF